MAKTSQPKTRRTEVRKNVVLEKTSLRSLIGQRHISRGLIFALVFWALASLIVLDAHDRPHYYVGQIVDRPIVARVEVEATDESLTTSLRQQARDNVAATYRPNEQLFASIRQKLVALPGNMANADSVSDVAAETVTEFALNNTAVRRLRSYQQEGKPTEEWDKLVNEIMLDYRRKAVLTSERFQIEKATVSKYVKLSIQPEETRLESELLVFNVSDPSRISGLAEDLTWNVPSTIQPHLQHFFEQVDTANYIYDNDTTLADREAAAAQVTPKTTKRLPGDVIVPATRLVERDEKQVPTTLTEDQYDLLQIERRLYRESLSSTDRVMASASLVAVVLLITVGIGTIILTLRRRVAENPMRAFVMSTLLLISLSLAAFAPPNVAIGAAVGAVMLVAMILTIAYSQLLAVGITTMQCLLVALAMDLSVGHVLVALAAGMIAIAQLSEVRLRGTLVRVGVTCGLVAALATYAVGVIEHDVVPGIYGAIGWHAVYALIGAVFVGFFVNGVLRFIEKTFRITTAMTLLELCDANQPLLRKLAQAAPGTYNHSLNLATLAEGAATAIGANGLLCRVAALYHDIGKMNKPAYFIENQGGGPNRHEKLSPAMSLLIITGHVKDGIELAREYSLPPVLHGFIASHHGTTLVEYFYHAAKKQSTGDQTQPSEFEFRYPGPKPQTREEAILMLCDVCESACRTLDEPTHNRIEQLVHNLAMKRLMDDQFDESDITLEDLHMIEESITKSLAGIYHGRVKYPAGDKESSDAKSGENKDRAAG